MERPLVRSETAVDIGSSSSSNAIAISSWSSNESLSKWLDLPASSSFPEEHQPRALQTSSNMLGGPDNSLHIPSVCVPGVGTELAGTEALNNSFSVADMGGMGRYHYHHHHHDKYADESIVVKHEPSPTYHHLPTPSNDHYYNAHDLDIRYSYDDASHNAHTPQSAFLQQDSNGDGQWRSASDTRFPYSQTRDGNSPFLSSEPSPPSSFPEPCHSDKMYTHTTLLSPLCASSIHTMPGDDQHLGHPFLNPEHVHTAHTGTPEQFVAMSDVASLGDASGSSAEADFVSLSDEYSHHSSSSVSYEATEATVAGGSVSFSPIGSNHSAGVVADTSASGFKRKRSEFEDESFSMSQGQNSLKRARAASSSGGADRGRGRPRKNTITSTFSSGGYISPVDAYVGGPGRQIEDVSGDVKDEDDGDGTAYQEDDNDDDDDDDGDDDDDDDDAYVPSRSGSPRTGRARKSWSNAARRGSTDSGGSIGRRRGTRAPGSAAQALRTLEAVSSVGASSSAANTGASMVLGYGEISLDAGDSFGDWDGGRGKGHPVPILNLTKKSRGRKVPVDQSTMTTSGTSGYSGEAEDYGNGAGLSPDGMNGGDSTYYHPSQMQYGSETSDSASTGYGDMGLGVSPSAPQHGRPSRGRYSSQVVPSPAYPSPFNNVSGAVMSYGAGAKVVSGGVKKASGERRYVCTAEGCGKCFVRGEHLKRHVRSLHTWDKPHKCPHPGCEKSFSRRDNLGQHVRVHM
ncbi:hypothetical protein K435DRAFT_141799 [Dendrothele bispora CBS 962.96]|uniref:C2H2-type domain-containing protein n=1 Tax=Dendrothele bispora (strain CBS 962.96) TaxID=1314807 RepID=A0A4S8LZ67_DENBC|nr:hypothetical protein K435DRAFT_141799 [Dendrothele bispora CBS 962.96]